MNLGGPLGWQALQDILQVGIGVMLVELGRLDQAHDCSRPLPCEQCPREQPVLALMRSSA